MRAAVLFLLMMGALPAPGAEPGVEIRDAWVRAVPPVAGSTAAYFVLVNPSEQALVLQGARAEGAAHTMMHGVGREGDERRMVHLGSVEVPAGGEVRFAPGGRHLMLTGFNAVPVEGESVRICLVLSSGELCHAFPVMRDKGN